MDNELEKWINEMINKGTFEHRADVIEFCVGATKLFCDTFDINQETLTNMAGHSRFYPLNYNKVFKGDGIDLNLPVLATAGQIFAENLMDSIPDFNQYMPEKVEEFIEREKDIRHD